MSLSSGFWTCCLVADACCAVGWLNEQCWQGALVRLNDWDIRTGLQHTVKVIMQV
jgi:hypothetical protein